MLTDAPSFQGAPAFPGSAARAAVRLPVLRKDFMIDTYQVAEARAWGADCILIILAAVDDAIARELAAPPTRIGHGRDRSRCTTRGTRPRAEARSPLIGINNRNLQDLRDDARDDGSNSRRMIPKDRIVVGESGIFTPADIARLAKVGMSTPFWSAKA